MPKHSTPKLPFATSHTPEQFIQDLIHDTQHEFICWKIDTSLKSGAPSYYLEGRTKKLYLIPGFNEFKLQHIGNNGESVLIVSEQCNSRNGPLQTLYTLIEKLNIEC